MKMVFVFLIAFCSNDAQEYGLVAISEEHGSWRRG